MRYVAQPKFLYPNASPFPLQPWQSIREDNSGMIYKILARMLCPYRIWENMNYRRIPGLEN
jgi:hypothetical protein